MVVTRRAAKAAALAAAQAAERPNPTLPTSTSDEMHSASDEDLPKPRVEVPPQQVSIDEPEVTKSQIASMRRSISWQLMIAHACAIVAVTTLAHGANTEDVALPYHALILLLCTVPLRTIIALSLRNIRGPIRQSGPFLALTAPVIFSSNALHLLATKVSPSLLLQMIGFSAMDICASWLKMTVNGNISTVERFPMIVATIFNASDMCLAAVISRFQPFVDVLYAFLLIRVFVNVRRLIALSMTIVRREDKQKTTS